MEDEINKQERKLLKQIRELLQSLSIAELAGIVAFASAVLKEKVWKDEKNYER